MSADSFVQFLTTLTADCKLSAALAQYAAAHAHAFTYAEFRTILEHAGAEIAPYRAQITAAARKNKLFDARWLAAIEYTLASTHAPARTRGVAGANDGAAGAAHVDINATVDLPPLPPREHVQSVQYMIPLTFGAACDLNSVACLREWCKQNEHQLVAPEHMDAIIAHDADKILDYILDNYKFTPDWAEIARLALKPIANEVTSTTPYSVLAAALYGNKLVMLGCKRKKIQIKITHENMPSCQSIRTGIYVIADNVTVLHTKFTQYSVEKYEFL